MVCLAVVAHVHHMSVIQTSVFGIIFPFLVSMAVAVGMATPMRRLRAKTKFEKPKQKPLLVVDDWAADEHEGSRRQVYLVTFPHPKSTHSKCGRKLIAPGSMRKQQVLQCLLDACKNPAYSDGWSLSRRSEVHLQNAGVWREYHQPDLVSGDVFPHDHAAVLAQPKRQFCFSPVKKALLHRHGLATHWSCTHVGYWSAVRYCSVPTPTKPEDSLDLEPDLWAANGEHPPLKHCREEPMTAAALRKRAESKYRKASAEGKAEKITELDAWPIVVENGFRNGPDDNTAHLQLIAHTKKYSSKAMQAFLFKRRHLLPGLIDSIWQWECVDDVLSEATKPRVDTLRAAAKDACMCGGRWPAAVAQSIIDNKIPLQELCRDVLSALVRGRSETTPVLVLAGARGGEGKSLFLKPLQRVFGDEYVFKSGRSRYNRGAALRFPPDLATLRCLHALH